MTDPFYNWFMLASIIPDSKRLKSLLDNYKSSQNIIDQHLCHRNMEKEYDFARAAEQTCLDNKILTITIEDPNYPYLLKQIPNPPAILYAKGKAPARNERMIAIVGSRGASEYMLGQARRLAKKCADYNITVISGMARGSDMAAHEGALESGKRTIAVLGESIMFKRSKENQSTIEQILENNGCIITEQPPFAGFRYGPNKTNLIARNRITTALADAVIITECEEKSGTMHAINYAKEQKKQVYAILPVNSKSNYYSSMLNLNKQKKLDFLDSETEEQLFLSLNKNSRA